MNLLLPPPRYGIVYTGNVLPEYLNWDREPLLYVGRISNMTLYPNIDEAKFKLNEFLNVLSEARGNKDEYKNPKHYKFIEVKFSLVE